MRFFLIALILAGVLSHALATDPAMVCSACVMVLGLATEINLQIPLTDQLKDYCDGNKACEKAAKALAFDLADGYLAPEKVCSSLSLCDPESECVLFNEWPIESLPSAPHDWPTVRKLVAEKAVSSKVVAEREDDVDLTLLKGFFDGTYLLSKLPFPALFKRRFERDPEAFLSFSSALLSLSSLPSSQEQSPLTLCGDDMDCAMTELEKLVFGSARKEGQDPMNPCGHDLECIIDRVFDQHLPMVDVDGDGFAPSDAAVLRGSDWRGADCNDEVNNVYPGRKTRNEDPNVDHNCNGIYGANETGLYEDMLCDVEQRGLIFLGDSATAHFHLPPSWVTANGFSGLTDFDYYALNEFDFPRCAWGSAHVDSVEDCPYVEEFPAMMDTIESIYAYMRDRNRCMHRDFQNIGVNGARTTSSMQLVNSAQRDPDHDHPVTAFYALIGNDVCNGHADTFDHMTKPDKFKESVLEALNSLDTFLPSGSHVVMVGLVDGRVLYDTLENAQHPIGTPYPDFYSFMNCYEINPCTGWLNTNETVRDMTTAWAESLNAMYEEIIQTTSFENFELIYINPDWQMYFDDWAKAGKDTKNLIEPVDGFHPSQTGNLLLAQDIWKTLVDLYPSAIGPINPHNAEIEELFGNQGGH